jgi:hypothetical protein
MTANTPRGRPQRRHAIFLENCTAHNIAPCCLCGEPSHSPLDQLHGGPFALGAVHRPGVRHQDFGGALNRVDVQSPGFSPDRDFHRRGEPCPPSHDPIIGPKQLRKRTPGSLPNLSKVAGVGTTRRGAERWPGSHPGILECAEIVSEETLSKRLSRRRQSAKVCLLRPFPGNA